MEKLKLDDLKKIYYALSVTFDKKTAHQITTRVVKRLKKVK